MEELIFKYLNKTLTYDEHEKLKDWLDESEENRVALNKLNAFYKNDESRLPMMREEVWNEINQRFGNPETTLEPMPSLSWNVIFKVAAVFLVISASVLVAYQYSIKGVRQEIPVVSTIFKEAPLGSKITTKLPDGTMVTLNSGSKISFPEQFLGNTREVSLSGEAFFEVEHDQNKPFLIHMNEDMVKVLGTSFNIRSYSEDSAVYVSVATGRVSYSIPSGDEVILEPDRMATYLPGKGSLTTGEVNKLQAFGWKDKMLYFNDTSFDKIMAELERWYGVQIEYDNKSKFEGSYSEQFNNPTLPEVLHSLSFVYRFTFEINEKKLHLNKITP